MSRAGGTDAAQNDPDAVSANASQSAQSEPAADCEFDAALKGKAVGKHIEDFPLEWWKQTDDGSDYEKTRFDFHRNCGGDASVVWIFLSTGWCGACENYAQTVQGQYAMLKDKGLRIVWIVGEDKEYNSPSVDYIKRYIAQKNVEYPIIRDGEFYQTKRFLDPTVAGTSLPRSYVLNAKNMEMTYAGGIAENASLCAMLKAMANNGAIESIPADCP